MMRQQALTPPNTKTIEPPCIYREGRTVDVPCVCTSGKMNRTIPAYGCSLKGTCVVSSTWIPTESSVTICHLCKDRKAEADDRELIWQVGVTTILKRKHDLLPRTLASLAKAGWENPRLFVDGGTHDDWKGLKYSITVRDQISALANWWLGLQELYARNPLADRYLMVQDDVIFVRGLRDYLSETPWPGRGYLNLFTFQENFEASGGRKGFFRASTEKGGLGALALVFNRESIIKILSSEHMVEKFRPFDFMTARMKEQPHRAKIHIDGGVVSAMWKAGMSEWCHNPSLVQHTGGENSSLNHYNPDSPCFPGESFDARTLLL